MGLRRLKRAPHVSEERRLARNQPRIRQCQQKFRVVDLELGELVALANLMADDKSGIPQRMQQSPEKSLLRLADGAAEEDQEIDIGVRTEMPPSITAERDQRDGPVRRTGH